jgi:hypothetical protein
MKDQRRIDRDQVRLLAVFHFVSAGLALFGLLFLVAHFMVFNIVMSSSKMWEHAKSPPPQEFFQIFKWFYVVVGLWFAGSGIANLLSGLFMRRLRHRVFSMIVAGFNCLHMPFGTILGIFTLVVLARESVRELYEATGTTPSP